MSEITLSEKDKLKLRQKIWLLSSVNTTIRILAKLKKSILTKIEESEDAQAAERLGEEAKAAFTSGDMEKARELADACQIKTEAMTELLPKTGRRKLQGQLKKIGKY